MFSSKAKMTEADFDNLKTITYCDAKEIKALYKEFLRWSPRSNLNKHHFYAKSCVQRDIRKDCVDAPFLAFGTNDD